MLYLSRHYGGRLGHQQRRRTCRYPTGRLRSAIWLRFPIWSAEFVLNGATAWWPARLSFLPWDRGLDAAGGTPLLVAQTGARRFGHCGCAGHSRRHDRSDLQPPAVSTAHAAVAQTFFCIAVAIALFTGRKWVEEVPRGRIRHASAEPVYADAAFDCCALRAAYPGRNVPPSRDELVAARRARRRCRICADLDRDSGLVGLFQDRGCPQSRRF